MGRITRLPDQARMAIAILDNYVYIMDDRKRACEFCRQITVGKGEMKHAKDCAVPVALRNAPQNYIKNIKN